ncbi:RHS repeat-associated core domain-containing protein [Hymenobacter arcticus]
MTRESYFRRVHFYPTTSGSGHALKFNQRANTADDAVWQWEYNSTSNTFSSPGTYAAGQLLVKETQDEQNQLVTEYLDKQGKTILKRVAASTTGKLVYEGDQWLSLSAPSGQLITIRRAIFGKRVSGTTADDAVFDPQYSADVTSYVQQLVALPNATVNVPIDYRRLGPDPYPGNGKYLLVEASYAPVGTGADLLTYCAYDNLDNLRLVISPEGVNTLVANPGSTLTEDFLRSWCFRYEYDGRHRVIRKQVPGTDPVALVYNQRNQVVLTQDGNQQQTRTGEWSFVKYDGLGRSIMTGSYKTDPNSTQATLQDNLDAETVFAEQMDNTTGIGYTLTKAFPRVTLTNANAGVALSENNLLTVTYYDRYDAPLLANNPALACSLATGLWLPVPRGLPTGTSTRTLALDGTVGNWLTSTSYYDKNYQVVQAIEQNQLSGVNTQWMEYDFMGKLLASTTSITQGGSNSVGYKDTKKFTYYGNGLPKETFQQVYNTTTNPASAQPEILLVKKGYNELNLLIAKYLHSADGTGSKFLQKVDYRYNIRGWLTHINNRDLDNNNIEQSPGVYVQDRSEPGIADPDLFGLELVYNNAEFAGAVSQYNGNIAQAMWQTRNSDPNVTKNNKLRAYNYNYDPTSRIAGAQYTTLANTGWDITKQRVDFSVSNIKYDGNGNLLSMTRQGTTSGGDADPQKNIIDQLTYSYKRMINNKLVGSNQLLGVDDAAPANQATHDFKDNGSSYNPSGNPEYTYDQNGNLTSDANKGITSISYTRLNQPAVITFKAMPSTGNVGGTIKYTYSAAGSKLTKQIYNGTSSTPAKTTNYAGPVVFETTPSTSSTPVFAQTAEGRMLYIPSSNGTLLPWKYEYHLKDHLGNLRYAFRADKDNNVVTQIKAGMEPASATQEEQQFQHVAETRLIDTDHARTGSYVARLNAGTGRREGPSVRLKVAAGDTIRAEVYGRYDRGAVAGSLFQKGALVTGSLSAGAPSQLVIDQAQPVAAQRRWLPFIGASIALVPELLKMKRVYVPTAYLRYEVFNKDSQLVATKTQPIQRTATDEWQHLQAGTKVDSAGFVQVSLVNESGMPAYFDDLVVNTVAPSPYQENHYDPFGLNLVGIEMANVPNSAFQYNGKEKLEDFGLNWIDYGARMYDAQLGRWHVSDPMSEDMANASPYCYALNNPILLTDPDGMSPVYNWGDGSYYEGSTKVDWTYVSSYINDGQEGAKQERGNGGNNGGQVTGGLNVINKPGTGIRKTSTGHYQTFDTEADTGDAGWANDITELAGGFTPLGTAIDIKTAISGQDLNGNEVTPFWRAAGLIPLVSEVRMAGKLAKFERVANKSLKSTLPAWKRVSIDMEHVLSGHMPGGQRVSSKKTLFPQYMTDRQVEATVRSAYQNVLKKVSTQGDRMLLQGMSNNGIKVEMWLNNATKTIETAYPIR